MTDTWIKNPLRKPEIGTRVCYNAGLLGGKCYCFGIVSRHTPKTFQIQLVHKETVSESGTPSYSTCEVKPLWDQPCTESLVTCRFYKNGGWATREDASFTFCIQPFEEGKSYKNETYY